MQKEYKKLKFDHTAKWYMHKPESILVNEIHNILWDFEIQLDHLILARRPDQEKIKINKKKKEKRICPLMDFAVPADYRMKIKKSKKRAKNLDFAREL